jgi:4-hydroxythreonine-4-phosphate dehydrogenase
MICKQNFIKKQTMDNQNVRVAITHGDTNGIGYELIFKAFAEPEMLELCTPIIYGSPKVAAYYRKAMNLPGQFSIIQKAEDAQDGRINLLAAVEEEVKVDMGMPTPESGQAAVKALDRAMTDYRNGLYDVLVTAPINNGNAQIENYPFQGHKKYIETCLGEGKKGLSILVGGNLRIASVTEKTPLKEVAAGITTDAIVEKVTLMQQTLKRDFMITNPRIAVLSLNPKSNEDTSCGIEEREVIIPAIDALAEKGVQAFGPYASDEFFGQGYFADFDGVMAMYHDQATTPFHSLYTEDGVIYTAGLPIIRTTADVTPSFSIAGTGHADETSFRHAIYLAIDAFRHRNDYDEASSNPLPKLYHEKRDESEKVRFSIPKKHSNAPFNPNAEVKS